MLGVLKRCSTNRRAGWRDLLTRDFNHIFFYSKVLFFSYDIRCFIRTARTRVGNGGEEKIRR